MSEVRYQRNVTVRHEVDVLVVGGGPAGVAAAWAAKKAGASVLLLEGHTCLGGLGTAGMVPAFMSIGDGEHLLSAGFGTQVLRRLYPGCDLSTGKFAYGSLSINAEALKRCYEEILLEADVPFVYQSQLIDVQMQGDAIDTALFAAKSGVFAVRARQYVDCTGDGDLCVWAGAAFEKGDEDGNMMAGTLCSLWAGVDWTRVEKPDARRIEEAIADGVFAIPDRSLPGMWKISDSVGGGNIGHLFGVDGTDERSMTKGFLRGRVYVREYEKYFKEYLTGYEQMELISTGSLLGIRESRRITCEKRLIREAFDTRAVYEDEIGRYCYSVDMHPVNNSIKEHEKTYGNFKASHLQKGESYGIPYLCLVPKGLRNALVAGRCIGTDRPMQGSMRVMPGCWISGQASGVAAALATASGSRPADLPVRSVQQGLLALGAYLPNAR